MANQEISKLISTYLKIKVALEAKAKVFNGEKKVLEGQMDTIKTALAKFANSTGQDTMSVKGVGTAFRAKKDFVSVTDWEELLCFCLAPIAPGASQEELAEMVEASNLNYLKKGVMKDEVKGFMEAWNDEDSDLPDNEHPERAPLPPGTKYDVERVINIRKA